MNIAASERKPFLPLRRRLRWWERGSHLSKSLVKTKRSEFFFSAPRDGLCVGSLMERRISRR